MKYQIDWRASDWVPEYSCKHFMALYESLCLSLEGLALAKKSGEEIHLVFNPSKKMVGVKTLYERQLKAIRTLLTSRALRDFWEACEEEQEKAFYSIWQKAMNDWIAKPQITKTEKKRKINQVKGNVNKIIKTMDSDPSLQREVTLSFLEALHEQWPETQKRSFDLEVGIEMIHVSNFLGMFSKELEEISVTDNWMSSHNNYPAHITAPTAETQFFISRLSPIVYSVLGRNKHGKVTEVIKTLFPHLNVSREVVRKANVE